MEKILKLFLSGGSKEETPIAKNYDRKELRKKILSTLDSIEKKHEMDTTNIIWKSLGGKDE